MKLPTLLKAQRKRLYFELVGNGLAHAGLAIATAVIMGRLFDQALLQGSFAWSEVWPMGLIMMSAAMMMALLRRHERVAAELMGQRYIKELRRRFFKRILEAQQETREDRRQGLILVRFVGDMNAIRNWISLGVARLTVGGLIICMITAALSWWHWALSLIVAAGVLGVSAIMGWQGKRLHSAIVETRRQQGRLAANMTEKIRNATVVQLHNQIIPEQQRLKNQSQNLLQASHIKAARIGELRGVIELSTAFIATAALFFSLYAVDKGSMSSGSVITVLSLVGFIASPLRDIGRAKEYWLANQVATSNLNQIAQRLKPLRASKTNGKLIRRGKLSFKKTSIDRRLSNVKATIDAGKTVALIGHNGSGKSTLLRLIVRLAEPTHGQLLIDGHPIRRFSHEELRKQIAYVSQDAPLLRGTIRYNLTYGLNRPSKKLFEEVCEQCGINDLCTQLPNGFDTRIGENANNISQGQRARIALARALLRQPKILLLDEAESNLDLASLKTLKTIIKQFEGTLVMATHQREIAQLADEIWHLRKGKLIAQIDNNKTVRQTTDNPSPSAKLRSVG